MSKADKLYQKMISTIVDIGTDTRSGEVRPVWADTNEPAYTYKLFGIVNTYDLREEFPLLTVRKQAWKNCIDEMLWIWQKGSNKVSELGSHIWDQWVGEDGTIGKSYGYQVSHAFQTVKTTQNKLHAIYGVPYSKEMDEGAEVISARLNQIEYIIHELMFNPFSRRIIANLYNIQDLDDMNLHPCCCWIQFNVTEEDGQRVLNMLLNQRSLDTIVAGGWDVAAFAALQCALAHYAGMIPGEFMHVIGDAHVYDRHVPIAKDLAARETYPAPKFRLNTEGKKSFFDLTVDNFIIEDYQFGEPVKNIPVAK